MPERLADTVEIAATPERLRRPDLVCAVGIVSHGKWYDGEDNVDVPDNVRNDKIRGDLILANLPLYAQRGYRVLLVEGGSSPEFRRKLDEIAKDSNGLITIVDEELDDNRKPKGYGAARRQVIKEAMQLKTGNNEPMETLIQIEPEKPLLDEDENGMDTIEALALAIQNGADFAISNRGIVTKSDYPIDGAPERPDENLCGLSPDHARSEAAFSRTVNRYLRNIGVISPDIPDIDWMGNRAIKNDPEVLACFLREYRRNGFTPHLTDIEEIPLGDELYNGNPDKYASMLFLSMVEFFVKSKEKDWKFTSVNVPAKYKQWEHQTEFEKRDKDSIRKRRDQRTQIITEMIWGTQLILGTKAQNPFVRN